MKLCSVLLCLSLRLKLQQCILILPHLNIWTIFKPYYFFLLLLVFLQPESNFHSAEFFEPTLQIVTVAKARNQVWDSVMMFSQRRNILSTNVGRALWGKRTTSAEEPGGIPQYMVRVKLDPLFLDQAEHGDVSICWVRRVAARTRPSSCDLVGRSAYAKVVAYGGRLMRIQLRRTTPTGALALLPPVWRDSIYNSTYVSPLFPPLSPFFCPGR